MDYEAAIGYPLEGDDAVVTILVGGLLLGAAFFASLLSVVIPFVGLILLPVVFVVQFPVGGYVVSVMRSTFEGGTEPPAFEDWGELFTDGFWVFVIQLVYWVPMFVLMLGAGLVLVVLLGGAGVVGGRAGAGVAGIGIVGTFLLFAIVPMAYSLVVGYLLPISVLAYAETGSVGESLSLARFRRVGTDTDYVVPFLVAFLGATVVGQVAGFLYMLLIGPFVQFAVFVAMARILALGYAEAEGIDTTAADPAATATTDAASVREDW